MIRALSIGLLLLTCVEALDRAYIAGGNNEYYVIDTTVPSIFFQTPEGGGPYCVAIDPAVTRSYVANFFGSDTGIFDAVTNAFITSIPAPATTNPIFVAVSPDGARAYVVNYQNNPIPSSVTVIDVATDTVIGTPINTGLQSQMIAITPDSAKMYVPNYGNSSVSVIVGNTSTPIAVQLRPIHLAITPAGNKVYVANFSNDSVSVIDTGTDTVIATIPLLAGSSPQFIGIRPDGAEAYVANYDGNTVTVIDTATDLVITDIPLPGGSSPWYIIFSSNGAQAYVANQNGDTVSIIDTSTHTVITTVAVGDSPVNLALLPSGEAVYVANQSDNFMSIIDTTTYTVTSLNGIVNANWIVMAPASLFPPTALAGKQVKNHFLTQTELANHLSWEAPSNLQNLIGYRIYRNSTLTDPLAFVPVSSKRVFEDHNRKKGKVYTYYITSVYASGSESAAASVTVYP